jgi:hypothetical protein
MRPIVAGSTDQSVVIRIIDSTDGTPETAVEHDTAGIDLWYRREGATATSITEAALASLDAAHSDGGIEHIGDGYYRLDLPDAAVAAGADGVMVGGTVTDMIVVGCYVPIVDLTDQFEDATLESTHSVADALRIILAFAAGQSSGGGTSTVTFRDVADSKNRISATVDTSGNRTAIGTLDGS